MEKVQNRLYAYNIAEQISLNKGHRLRKTIVHPMCEVRIGPEEYHETVREILRAGYTLSTTMGARPYILFEKT